MSESWPQWTAKFLPKYVKGEDQLGVESAAQGYQQFLLPGIITTTDHARYYSFYAWVLHRFIKWPDSSRLLDDFKGTFFKHHEAALIAACRSHHPETDGIPGLVGRRSATSIWESGDPVNLDTHYFDDSLGGFGQYYRTAMTAMGILAESEHPKWVYRLTTRGKDLAEAYADSVSGTAYSKVLRNTYSLDRLHRTMAAEYGQVGCICPEALARGQDCEVLRDTLFRFDQSGQSNPHVRRRLGFGVALDLVHSAAGELTRNMIRPALYLGEYAPGSRYAPHEALTDWAARWRMVVVRHTYTFGLQCLWAAFLLRLASAERGLTLESFLDWIASELPSVPACQYLDTLCEAVGLAADWRESYSSFSAACLQGTHLDEQSLAAEASSRNGSSLVLTGSHILAQLFLRFLPLQRQSDELWNELANRERLPMNVYFDQMYDGLTRAQWTIKDWLSWLYREFILGQHEFVALEKLRYQGYDTYKFSYEDGVFHWPRADRNSYREPIRLPALRLLNVVTILVDLGLVAEDDQGRLNLTPNGQTYRQKLIEAAKRDSQSA